MVMLADISTQESRGRMMSFYQGSILVGAGLGPTLGGFVAELWEIRAPFFVLAVMTVMAALWAYVRLPETRPSLTLRAVPGDVPRSTVGDYLMRVRAACLDWSEASGLSDAQIESRLFPTEHLHSSVKRPAPDCDYIHRELRMRLSILGILLR